MSASKEKKENSESEITYLANEFFSISKEDNVLTSHRTTLKGKLWIALWQYYKEIQYTGCENNDEVIAEKYSGIIHTTIANAMETYKCEKETPFLHYVNAAVKNEISRERQKSYLHGLKVPQKIFRQWKQLVQLAHSRGIDIRDIHKMRQLGSLLGYSENVLEHVLDFGNVTICSDRITVDGKESSAFDMLESDIGSPEKEFEKKEAMKTVLHQFFIIDSVFSKKQERVKAYVSALLTLQFYRAVSLLFQTNEKQETFSFIDANLFNELQEKESRGEKLPAQQDIAWRFGKDKTDASRTLNRFLDDVKKEVGKTVNCVIE